MDDAETMGLREWCEGLGEALLLVGFWVCVGAAEAGRELWAWVKGTER